MISERMAKRDVSSGVSEGECKGASPRRGGKAGGGGPLGFHERAWLRWLLVGASLCLSARLRGGTPPRSGGPPT